MHHLFIRCPWVAKFWNHFLVRFGVSWVQPAFVRVFLDSWSALFVGNGRELAKDIWLLIPSTICWMVWEEKNGRTFEDRTQIDRLTMDAIMTRLYD